MAWRNLAHSSQADLYEPRPSCFCSCRAAIPLECVAIRYAAQNQTVSGSFEPCITVPAVTEVCLPQPAHSRVKALVESSQLLSWPQSGQRNPSGQRASARYAAHAHSSGKPC